MCDYSLEMVASRPAVVGDKLISTNFRQTISRGFAAQGELGIAVCLMPGTEVAFDRDFEYQAFGTPLRTKPHRVARFRHINDHQPHAYHDALEFPDGEVILLTRLVPGQNVTVLQLPASAVEQRQATPEEVAYSL